MELIQKIKIMEKSLRAVCKHIDNFIEKCQDEDGKPKAPSRGEMAALKAILPPGKGYKNSFQKRK